MFNCQVYVNSTELMGYEMNRDEANLLVDLYGRHLGAKGAQLNEHDMVLFLWNDGQVYLQRMFPNQPSKISMLIC